MLTDNEKDKPEIVRKIIVATLKAGQKDNGKAGLKRMNISLKEK